MTQQLIKNSFWGTFKEYGLITLGLLAYALGWTICLLPNNLVGGGVSGFAAIIYYATGIPLGYTYLVVNVVLLLIAIKILGTGFGGKTIYAIIMTGICLNVFPGLVPSEFINEFAVSNGKLICTVLGGIIAGVGIGISISQGGSTGGTDIIAMMINKYWPVSPGMVYLYTDIFIISCLLFVPDKGLVDLIYAFVVMLGFSFGVDFVLLGNKSSVQILVFSSKYQEIADHIINNVHRGVTALQSVGWYSQKESKVLLIIARKYQMNEVVNEIKSIDKKAFISVSTAMSVFGEGFEEVKTGLKIKKNKEELENEQ